MNWDAQTWFTAAAFVLSVLAIAGNGLSYFFKNTSQDEAATAVEKLEAEKFAPLKKSVIDHDRRIIKIEGVIEALPKSRDFNDLSEKISDVAGDVKGIVSDIRSLREGLQRTERDFRLVTESLMPTKGQ